MLGNIFQLIPHDRTLDPFLGLFTGVLAYKLWENNPRSQVEPDQRLSALIQWKLEKSRAERDEKMRQDELQHQHEWKSIVVEAEGKS
jgi:hypothetical protein